MSAHIAVLEELAKVVADEAEAMLRGGYESRLCGYKVRGMAERLTAAIALMRGQSEVDELRSTLHNLADYWIGITRDQDIAFKDRPLLEMYDKGLTKCATDLRNKLRKQERDDA